MLSTNLSSNTLIPFSFSFPWSSLLLNLCVEFFSLLIVLCLLSHLSHVWLFVTLWTVAHQAALSIGFSRQEYWSGLPCPSSSPLAFLLRSFALLFQPHRSLPLDLLWCSITKSLSKKIFYSLKVKSVLLPWRRKWQPTPVFLPGESYGWRNLVGCCPQSHTESDRTKAT